MHPKIFASSLLSLVLTTSQVAAENVPIHNDITPNRVPQLDFSPSSAGIETLSDTDECSLAVLGDGRLQFTSKLFFKIKSADGASKLYEFDIRNVTSKFLDPTNPSNAGWDGLYLFDEIRDDQLGWNFDPYSFSLNQFEEQLCDALNVNIATFPNENIFVVSENLWVYMEATEWDDINGTNSFEQEISGFAIQAHNATTGARLWKKTLLTGGNWYIDTWLSGVGDFLPAAGLEYRLAEEFESASDKRTIRYTYYDLDTGAFISSHTVTK